VLDRLDHVIVTVHDLEAAEAVCTGLLGREPSWRGEHPGAGSANVLYRLENTYLELLAPAGEGGVGDLLRAHLEARGEGLLGLAFGTGDAEVCRGELAARGLEPAPVTDGSGREAGSGIERAWRSVMLPGARTRGILLFAIEQRSPEESLPVAPASSGSADASVHALDHVVVRTADPEAAVALYGAGLGLRLALDRSFEDWGVRLLFFRIGGLTVEVAAALPSAAPEAGLGEADRDRLWGLSWRVGDVEAARARLAGAGFDVSPVRRGRKPGTRVCTVRGEPCGVATLLIGPEPP
jgi:catechol 2,3-dioxygenase-like lactoylglutathione lyase family enzyme